jgi:hypothetical protein
VDSTAPNIGREFGTVYLGDKNVAYLVVAAGWARVSVVIIYIFLRFLSLTSLLLIYPICLTR